MSVPSSLIRTNPGLPPRCDTSTSLIVDIGRDEERIRAQHQFGRRTLKMRQLFSRSRSGGSRIASELQISRRDKARAITKRFLDQNLERFALAAPDNSIQPVAAARLWLDAQKGNGGAIIHAVVCRIRPVTTNRSTQQQRVRRVEKSRYACAERRPCITISIDRAQHDERQFGKEKAMLVDKMAADHPRPHHTHTVGHANTPLHMHFASVPRREPIFVTRM